MRRPPRRRPRRGEDREDAVTKGGKVVYNHLQQPDLEEDEGEFKPEVVSTDPNGITER